MDMLFTNNLARCIEPDVVALVGASNRPGSFGRRTLDNLKNFKGRLYLVSTTAVEIDGMACFKDIASLPEPPDCVVMAVPRDACEAVVRECAEAGVGGVVVYASGFAETGQAQHVALQARITAIAAEARMALFGPNCLGVVNFGRGALMSFIAWPEARPPVAHSLGLISQSGSLGLSLAQAACRGVSFSHVLTYGNAAGLDAADLLGHLADSPACAAIVCVIESSRSPLRLAAAVRRATAAGKPVVLQKIACTEQGRSAALSHTGSLAGAHDSYRALLEDAGAVWVDDFEALIEMGVFLAKFPAPTHPARGVAVIGGSGGGGILAADKASKQGVLLPQPSARTSERLSQHIPDFGSARNPCDVTAQVVSRPQSLAACCHALAEDDAFGVLVSTHTSAAPEFLQRLPIYEGVVRASSKPMCTVWLAEWHEGPGALEFERSAHVALFHSVDRCFTALREWYRRADRLADRSCPSALVPANAQSTAHTVLSTGTARAFTESASKQLLTAYGIPVTTDVQVSTPAAAQAAAMRFGVPVALKVEADGLAHKSDAGGVSLDLKSPNEIAAAWEWMTRKIAESTPGASISGFIVSPMVKGHIEMIVGGRNDAEFGPLITVGFGGVLVELLRDTVTEPAPVNPQQALRMLRSLRGADLFDGMRGMPAIDLKRLAEIVSLASLLLAEHPDTLAELDINPVICGEHDIRAVDALAVRTHIHTPPGKEPEQYGQQVVYAD